MEDLIPILLFFLFFVLPSVLKSARKAAGKKKGKPATPASNEPKKESIFSRIRKELARLQEEAERRQREQKEQGAESSGDFWQMLTGEKPDQTQTVYEEDPEFDEPEADPVPDLPAFTADRVEPVPELRTVPPIPEKRDCPAQTCARPGQYRKNPLQNAVVWAEILGKPVALK